LLRKRSKRPHRRYASEQRNEIAPSHYFPEAQRKPSYRLKLALGKVPIGVKKQAVERRTDVRFGSKADILVVNRDIGFTSKASILRYERHVRYGPIADIALARPFGKKRPPTEAASIIHGFAQTRTI
jgi:hypothetical protein